jgi:uncharacterized spore protein YtfJ
MSDVSDVVGLVAEKIQEVVKSRAVVGEAVSDGKRTVVPLSEVCLFFGGAGGGGSSHGNTADTSGKGEAGLSGGAVMVRPLCAVVIDGDEVRIEAVAR